MPWRDAADIEIVVTQYDIDMAKAYNASVTDYYTDPISHAIKRKLGHRATATWGDLVANWFAMKYMGTIAYCDVYYETETKEYDILGGERAGKLLKDWWHGRRVEPQKFMLRYMKSRKKLEAKRNAMPQVPQGTQEQTRNAEEG